jgi:predicted nucleic acid-binding Zn ribbon protein
MSDAPLEKCGLRQARSKVLYPVSVHFKGSGFYSTDYGRGGRKKTEAPKEGGSGDSGAAEKKSDSGEKKAAAAD